LDNHSLISGWKYSAAVPHTYLCDEYNGKIPFDRRLLLAESLEWWIIDHLWAMEAKPFVAPTVDSATVFKMDIFNGKVLFCTGR
jgi:hypothetical protein